MKLGVSTSCFYPLETELSLEEIGKAGVKNAEIFFNCQSELKPAFIDILLGIKRKYGINITSVHPTLSLAESFMIFSSYERRLREGIEIYRRYAEIAEQLGAEYIILHGGKPGGALPDEEYCERFSELQNAAQPHGVTVLQENVVRHGSGDFEFLRSLKSILGNEAAFCVDLKQSIRCGYSPIEAIDLLGDSIKHFHISDHSAASDCLLPGRGGFDFEGFFRYTASLGYRGAYIIEVYSDCYADYSDIFDSYRKLNN